MKIPFPLVQALPSRGRESLDTLPRAAAGASPVLAHNVVWWLAFFLNGPAAYALIRPFAQSRLVRRRGQGPKLERAGRAIGEEDASEQQRVVVGVQIQSAPNGWMTVTDPDRTARIP